MRFLSIFLLITPLISCSDKTKTANDYQTGYEVGFKNGASRVCKRFKSTLADSDWDHHAPKECR